MRTLAFVALAATLASCTTPEEKAVGFCDRMGVPPGTPAYEGCVQHAADRYEAQREQSLEMIGAGLQMMSQPQPRPIVTTTTCTDLHSVAYCSSITQ